MTTQAKSAGKTSADAEMTCGNVRNDTSLGKEGGEWEDGVKDA